MGFAGEQKAFRRGTESVSQGNKMGFAGEQNVFRRGTESASQGNRKRFAGEQKAFRRGTEWTSGRKELLHYGGFPFPISPILVANCTVSIPVTRASWDTGPCVTLC